MKENIEIKDVQKTEYLNKNGLDMLWAKVKENTHNQVEVEYNRAKAKEDSLSQEIASVKPAEGKVFLQVEDAEGIEDVDVKILKGYLLFGDFRTGTYAGAADRGFYVGKNFKKVEVSPTGIKADVGRMSDTKVWNTNGGITDLASYALNSDVIEKIAAKADTTALTALEEKATSLLSDLNLIYKEKKETEQRFAKIEETINRMESTVTNFINSFHNGQGNSNTAQ